MKGKQHGNSSRWKAGQPDEVEIREEDIEEIFTRSSGPGGQNVNKVSTRVILKHVPSGIQVVEQGSRSQHINRQNARERLVRLLTEARATRIKEKRDAREKKRRQSGIKPAGVKRRILEQKRKRADKKGMRKKWRTSHLPE